MPGCWSQGQTEQEATENIKDAIEAYLAAVDGLSQDKESRSSLNLQYRRKTSTARRTPPSPVSVIW
jgi:predicted RNase H-like HicB family nuclease